MTQAAMFLKVCQHEFARLPAQPVDRFGFLGLHPGLMGEDAVVVFAASNTATALLARRALRSPWADGAGGAFDPLAHHDFLTPPTPHIRFASHPLEHLSRWTTIGLQLGQPLAWRLGCTHVVGFPGAVQGHLRWGT
jgi:hypothetical protein